MCAALLGLMLECSTRILPAGMAAGGFSIGGERGGHPCAIDPDVQVAGRRNLHLGDAFDGADLGANRFGNLQRSRAQRLGERKNRNREVPEFDLRRLFDDHAGQRDAGMTALQTLQHALGQTMFEMTIQEVPLSC